MGPKKKAKTTIPHLRRQSTRLQAVHSETQSDRAAHLLPSVDGPPLSINRMVESSPSIDCPSQPSLSSQQETQPSPSSQMGGQLSTHTEMRRETEPCTSVPVAPSLEAENVNLCFDIGDRFVVVVDSNGDRVKRQLHSIPDIWHLPEGERIEMEINLLGQPIKKQDSKVVRFGGLIARSNKLVPIIYKDWRSVPNTVKEEAWGLIKGKFKVPDDKLDVFKKWILKDLGKKWKDYKHELKKKLLNEKDTSAAQVVARASPDMVDLEQLAELANLWFDPEYMSKCNKNKECRKKQVIVHSGGSKSLARYAHDVKKSTGALPSRAQLFVKTHKKKDGTHYNDETRKKVVEMEELLTQDANPIEMGSGGTMTWKSDDVYSKVMGLERPGRVRGLGFGPIPTKQTCQHSLPTSNQENGISKEEFDKMRNELIDLRNLVNTFVHAQASGKNQNENEEEEKDEEEENAEEEEDQEEDEEAEENDEDND
ncbi:hypothetical protein CIPAW_16G105200 [Carya illinoinensis]|uniref:Transposase n=2 Tax=Carya illinoinensis TaxID=32201 RepID=A0A8T1N5G1_CARIL|nr:hypothetical protein CIPAW_16G105200 [Carya illinoinensis]